MNKGKRIILLCERGWREARELSIFLAGQGLAVSILIKGQADQEVRRMITPYPRINNIFIPRKFYSLYVSAFLTFCAMTAKSYFFTSKDKIRGLVKLLGLPAYFISSGSNGYLIKDAAGRTMEPNLVLREILS
ncbi:hypothetical protein ACFL2I_00725 [Candidatus Omnitrophota bacterium]